MLYSEMIIVYSDINIKHKNVQCGQNANFFKFSRYVE
jgi:hypothetical protein